MKILVKAKPYSKEEKVEKIPQEGFDFLADKMDTYKVWIKEVPEDGKANDAVVRMLAKYFNVNKRDVRLLVGSTNRDKIFEVNV